MKSLLLYTLAQTAAAGSFNVLSFNVAGLPEILNSNEVPGDKTTNTEAIGAKFAEYDYDVIHVQEDFNYHAHLYKTDTHPYRTATSGGAGIGSGLNTLSNYDWVDFERVKWATCSEASGADCLTPKGFTVMRVRVEEGVYLDFYNLHADAGSETEDVKARSANLQQVADHIQTNSAGNAVLVFGDTNARYTSSGENIRVFTQENNMANPWIDLILHGDIPPQDDNARICENPNKNNSCETVDKIFYRGSRVMDLQATFWKYADYDFLSSNGTILSDHNPITSNFTYSLSDSLRQSDLFGGPHGTWFNDLTSIPDSSTGSNKPQKITLRGDNRLDAVSLFTSGSNHTHGGDGGTVQELSLADDEYWTHTTMCQGKHNDHTRIFSLSATTSKGKTVSAGTKTEDCKDFVAEDGWQVVGFYGQDGDEIDQLGLIYSLQ
ncbi:hypothetical protein ASPWEDRAFT_169751 [Aspergillus wentii DTO 134E9]|uniref:Jacalin-type lectin domain-containing protein n=1 Tax=Aspergillus wentii DTO 134E9 TaxID=1073089 RepID=A0A1L9RYL2_ASPWE|nr:uncharacterized protein ASPWEDRAFT_169751 [Aspergillus wentii DTO 134E9]KAI9931405.1 hypothetical protein MW887_009980 [Aspergillus wentii]OJJ39927.1 hypothetical protein ASPWEDRAFT_169751 [Aspergillus wentii DTO 134E9]